MMAQDFGCDLLVISPHTDDAEIGLGGTIATLTRKGRRVWVVDLTRGELGSNASADERWVEAAQASQTLGLTGRLQLSLPDGFVNAADREHLIPVIWALRTFRPRWVVSAPDPVRHPDHVATAELVRRAAFLARLTELSADEPEYLRWQDGADVPATADLWIVPTVLSVCPTNGNPSLLFDVTEQWATKENSLQCYASQFQRSNLRRPTMINDGSFLERIQRRARNWGRRAGCQYAEAFCTDAVPVLHDFPDVEWRS